MIEFVLWADGQVKLLTRPKQKKKQKKKEKKETTKRWKTESRRK